MKSIFKIILNILDAGLFAFWNIFLVAAELTLKAFSLLASFISSSWRAARNIGFLYPFWRKINPVFSGIGSLWDSRPIYSARRFVSRQAGSFSLYIKGSKMARRIFFIPVLAGLIYMLFYGPLFYCAYRYKYQTGIASWYGPDFYFNRTASGDWFLPGYFYTAAHNKLPLGICVLVENKLNGKKTVVKINDRGPFVKGRILDLSWAAARKLGVYKDGTAPIVIYTLRKY